MCVKVFDICVFWFDRFFTLVRRDGKFCANCVSQNARVETECGSRQIPRNFQRSQIPPPSFSSHALAAGP